MNSLLELQRRMAKAVMQPLTANDGMQRNTGDGRSMAAEASGFIQPNSRLTSFERLEIYNRQYWFRILDSLAEDFPGLRAVIGEKRFYRMARRYLTDCPSQSFTMRNLGSQLLAWLDAHAEFTEPHRELALDMARLEWAHIEAFDSAERPPLTPAQIAELNGEAKLLLQPYIRLLRLHYAVDDILLARKDSTRDIAALDGRSRTNWLKRFGGLEEISLAVHRAEFSVHYRRLEPASSPSWPRCSAGSRSATPSRVRSPNRPPKAKIARPRYRSGLECGVSSAGSPRKAHRDRVARAGPASIRG